MAQIKLYSYYRSSASYRVRVALNLKKIDYEYLPIHLVKDGGEQNQTNYLEINPMGEVPSLLHEGKVINQSMAIIQYLDSISQTSPLFPEDPYRRAKVIEVCEIVNCGIHPLQNLKALQKIEREFDATADDKTKWAAYWIIRGFQGLERILQNSAGTYSFGDSITAADLFISPQVYNARRFGVDVTMFPIIEQVEKNCLEVDAFQNAYPGVQPDTPND